MKEKYFFLTYADHNFKTQLFYAKTFAKFFGKFDGHFIFKPKDIDKDFREKNKKILSQKKGGGYWLWKPFFINKVLGNTKEGDFIFYSDAGSVITYDIKKFATHFKNYNQDIFLFELPLIEKQWTKKQLILNMNVTNEMINSNQISGTPILIRNSKSSKKFFKEFLELCCKEENIVDSNNIDEDECFINHRHDQSIISLLYKKYNLYPFKDPSQYGEFPQTYAGVKSPKITRGKLHKLSSGRLFRANFYKKNYSPKVFNVMNRKENPLVTILKYHVKNFLSKLNLYEKI